MLSLSSMRKPSVISFIILFSFCTTPSAALQIGTLLSTCVDACQRGCHEIRAVQARRQETGDSLKVNLKEDHNPRSALTEADGAAQLAIVGSLRAEWGDSLRIIGEEDDDEQLVKLLKETTFAALDKSLFEDDIGETPELDVDQVTVYVDPLDGTREFVEGRLENCQVLVGIAIGDESVAGAIGIPFPAGDLSTESTIVYGLADAGTGVMGEPLTRGPFPLDHNIDGVRFPRPHIATGDNKNPVIVAAKEAAVKRFRGSNVIYGGAGNKILAAALGEVACCIGYKYGGPWDLCAPEAILKGMGGRMTDLFGQDIAIYGPNAPPRCRERGYVATPSSSAINHDALTAALKADPVIQEYQEEVLVQ